MQSIDNHIIRIKSPIDMNAKLLILTHAQFCLVLPHHLTFVSKVKSIVMMMLS